ncbi:uncharacterized protein MICPUCDRAFT_60413 [Micromonas pusilla CCMP1545]|jgi:hypothetical protein|uniref:Predicted protein n=1 Tax=Micromonas pusilla (strain CCMP1545) TaxID=564608 RepID=C1MY61_MICPC|nr:uncharacterized protein MICPUCDRAFT_60413 [Micromonas pusilla CCMP1545]EEH55583.1 predicted protein [Micromonas pusilla CCMP1545]|eukprot:XP_003060814.1 predicted protein [Micromonas pusilla CCMP1545]
MPRDADDRDVPRGSPPDKALIVHPRFKHLARLPPLEFCPMDWLPDEVLRNVVSHLDGVSLAKLSTVCTRTRYLCDDERVWRDACADAFPLVFGGIRGEDDDERPAPCDGGWREAYKTHHTVLYELFRGGGTSRAMEGRVHGALGEGLGAMSSGRYGRVGIRVDA